MNLIVLASLEHKNEGHFESWREEILKSATRIGVQTTFLIKKNQESANQFLIRIFDEATRFLGNGEKLHIHHEWAHELSNAEIDGLNKICKVLGIEWSTHASISRAFRKTKAAGVSSTKKLLKTLEQSKQLRAIWTWDVFLADLQQNTSRFLSVPDIQDVEISREICDFCSIDKSKFSKCVGLTGQLYGYRGADKLVELSRKNPNILFFASGKLHRESLKNRTIEHIDSTPHNLLVKDGFIDKSSSINHFISHLDALLIDTERYPDPSGIAIRALSLGKILLITDENSFLSELTEIPNVQKLKHLRSLKLKTASTIPDLSHLTDPQLLDSALKQSMRLK